MTQFNIATNIMVYISLLGIGLQIIISKLIFRTSHTEVICRKYQ